MKYLFYIFLFLFWANAFAQNNFHSTYDYNNQNDFGIVILEFNQLSNLVIFGNTTRGIRGAKILFVDSMGSSPIHLNYSYVNNPSFNGGLKNGNSYYGYGAQYNPIEGAADSYLLKMNLMGDTLRAVSSNFAFNDRIHDMHLKADSTFIVYGFYTDTIPAERKPYVANIDTLGNVLWFKTHSKLGFDATIVNLQATAAGGYVFSGVEEETPGGHLDLFLTKVDSVGNLVWKKYYHELLSQKKGHVEVLHDGNYALFGTGYHPQGAQRAILKIDQAGNLIWRRKHGINNLDEGYNVGKELPNGNFICAGSSIRMYNGLQVDDINLSMLDSAGNLLWSRDYNYHGLDINQYVRDLIVTSDGGFAMTGFILNAPGGTGNDVFVLKTDTNGLITSLNSGFREVTPDMKVYPNPTKDFVNVPYVEGLERIELYDVGGKLLQNFVILSDSRSVNKIDLSNYTNGIYILKLYMKNGEIYSKKVIKE